MRLCFAYVCCMFLHFVLVAAQVALVEESVVPALHEAVSELRHYSTDSGLPFRCAKLPSLRLCIHTGFDQEPALLHFRSALLYTPPVSPLDKVNGQVFFVFRVCVLCVLRVNRGDFLFCFSCFV